MAKRDNNDENIEVNESVSIVTVPAKELAKFENYLNPFDVPTFAATFPEWIAGDALVGQLIAIHSIEKGNSFHFKTEFYKCEIEIAGQEGKFTATFFSVGCKTFFKAVENAGLPLPMIVGVIRQNSTYAFQDVNKFLASQR